MMTATVFEAKTKLSELIKKAQAGEKIVITSGRNKVPVAEITAIEPPKTQRLGFLAHLNIKIPDSFFDPLSDEEMGEFDDANDPLNWSDERIQAENTAANGSWDAELGLAAKHDKP